MGVQIILNIQGSHLSDLCIPVFLKNIFFLEFTTFVTKITFRVSFYKFWKNNKKKKDFLRKSGIQKLTEWDACAHTEQAKSDVFNTKRDPKKISVNSDMYHKMQLISTFLTFNNMDVWYRLSLWRMKNLLILYCICRNLYDRILKTTA